MAEENKDDKTTYPNDLAKLLAEHKAETEAALLREKEAQDKLKALHEQQEKTQKELENLRKKAADDEAARKAEEEKKLKDADKKGGPSREEIRLMIEESKEQERAKFQEELKALQADAENEKKRAAALEQQLLQSSLDKRRAEIIAEAKGRLIRSRLEGATSLKELDELAVLAKKEYEEIISAEEAAKKRKTAPDPTDPLSHREIGPDDKEKVDVHAKLEQMIRDYGKDRRKWSEEQVREWTALQREAEAFQERIYASLPKPV